MAILLSVLIAAVAAQAAPGATAAQVTPHAAVESLKAAFAPGANPTAQAGALLNYFALGHRAPAGAADPVAAAVRAQAAEFLAVRMPAGAEERFAWSQRLAILNRLRDELDEGQSAQVQERVGNMARSRRAEVTAMVENATRDWRFEALGLLEDAPAVAAPAEPKTNVVKLQPAQRRPEAGLKRYDPDVRPFPEPAEAALLGYARTIRRELGWGKMALHRHDHTAEGEEVREGEHAVVLELHGNPAMIASVDLSGMVVGFGNALSDAEIALLRKAGVPLNHVPTHPARFKTYHDENPLKDSGWFQRWRDAHILGL